MGGWAPHCDGRQFAALEKSVAAPVICCYYFTSALLCSHQKEQSGRDTVPKLQLSAVKLLHTIIAG